MKISLSALLIGTALAKNPKREEYQSSSSTPSSESLFGYQVLHPRVPFSRAAALCASRGHELAQFNPLLTPLLMQALRKGKTNSVWMGSSSPVNVAVSLSRENHKSRNFIASFLTKGSKDLFERTAVLCKVVRVESLTSSSSHQTSEYDYDDSSTSSTTRVKRNYKKKSKQVPKKPTKSVAAVYTPAKDKAKRQPSKRRQVHYEESSTDSTMSVGPSESTQSDEHSSSSSTTPVIKKRQMHPKRRDGPRMRRVAEQMKKSNPKALTIAYSLEGKSVKPQLNHNN